MIQFRILWWAYTVKVVTIKYVVTDQGMNDLFTVLLSMTDFERAPGAPKFSNVVRVCLVATLSEHN